ncbi:MAG: hypothetical protein DWQ09_08525 [Proteobacteria bacterium]|nr:MAG: hypothetical protein DWQ09_08525 [Pseudomonadota bacterium]QKK10791.1 MAG: thioredoxin fold domain-containing protein [Pseudomonadota bacterium]
MSMTIRHSRIAGFLVGLSLFVAANAQAAVEGVPEARDLSVFSSPTARSGLPLLLVFTADGCGYCIRLADEVLVPMIRSGEYDERATIRAVNLSRALLVDFTGASVAPWEFARRYDVKVTPTLIVVDREGTPLAKPLVGLGTSEYFELSIAEVLDEAAGVLARRGALPAVRGSP